MTARHRPPLRTPLLFLTVGLLAALAYWVLAASPPSPSREEMTLDGRPVVVEYAPSASAEDLMLPFYPEAEVDSSFAYTVKTRDGIQIAYYASAVLATPDPPEKVADAYRTRLPGEPGPQTIEDPSGKRWVLAVAGGDEVRMVSISVREAGSRIELTRAARPVVPSPAPRPRAPGQTPA
ncbi:MAG: hypothetical protein JSV79_06575 [Armatimonadota bacterium]|nr:MAG: hypothetical protein JSV79_06575 [Armatimonadota bacterium]